MRKTTGGLPTLREAQKAEDKAVAQGRTRRKKIIGLVAIVLAVLSAVGFLVYHFISAAASSESRILSVVPSNADTVVVAPSSKEWWNNVTRMAPLEFNLNHLDPYGAGLDVSNLGYARFDDTVKREVGFTGPVRSVYVESSSDEGAEKIENWLRESKGNESRSIYRDGNVVKVSYNWVTGFEAPEKDVDSRSDFSIDATKTTAGMWINFDNQIDALSGKDNPEKPLVANYFEKTFALKPNTSWSGTSSNGVTWEGEYVSGGIDINKFDPEDARVKLMKTRESIAEVGEGTGIYDNRLYTLIVHSGAKKTGEDANYGAAEVISGDFSLKDEKLGATIEPSQWNTAVRGLSAQEEGVTKIDMSFSDSRMNLVFRYGNVKTEPQIPELKEVVIPPGAEVIEIDQ